MIKEGLDAALAGFRVGSQSASQFGREYNQLFGARPATGLRRLRRLLDTGMTGLLSGPPDRNQLELPNPTSPGEHQHPPAVWSQEPYT